MRLQAKEDEVYHLMDLKEWFSVLTGLGSFLEGIALYFFIFRIRAWDLAYLCVALALSIIFLLRQTAGISRRSQRQAYNQEQNTQHDRTYPNQNFLHTTTTFLKSGFNCSFTYILHQQTLFR